MKNKIINLDADVNILGNLTAANTPTQPDWVQTDETQTDYIKNKPALEKGSGQYAIQQASEVNTFDFYGFGTEVNIDSNDTFKIITYNCGKTLYRGELFYCEGAIYQVPLNVNKVTFTENVEIPRKYCAACNNLLSGCECIREGKEPTIDWYLGNAPYQFILIKDCNSIETVPVGASGNEASSKGASAAQGSRAKSSGYHTIALGSNSSAEGISTFAGNRENLQEGHATHAEGYKTRAEGRSAHAEGNQT
jgi:hypothetical protein